MSAQDNLAWTFDTQAESYAKMRPGYPEKLYKDIFEYIAVNGQSRAVEIGIGGGQATLPILDTGCQVVAVERGEHFVRLCADKFKACPNFSVINARFEEVSFAKDSCDLVYSASAFHWIPEETGYSKVFEMLRSGGAFARFANHPYKDKGREELHKSLQEIYAVYMPGSLPPDEYSEQDAVERAELARKYGFTDIACHLYKRTRTFSAKAYTQLLGTYSDHIALEETTRKRFFSEIERVIHRYGGQITLYDTLDLELARKP